MYVCMPRVAHADGLKIIKRVSEFVDISDI